MNRGSYELIRTGETSKKGFEAEYAVHASWQKCELAACYRVFAAQQNKQGASQVSSWVAQQEKRSRPFPKQHPPGTWGRWKGGRWAHRTSGAQKAWAAGTVE